MGPVDITFGVERLTRMKEDPLSGATQQVFEGIDPRPRGLVHLNIKAQIVFGTRILAFRHGD